MLPTHRLVCKIADDPAKPAASGGQPCSPALCRVGCERAVKARCCLPAVVVESLPVMSQAECGVLWWRRDGGEAGEVLDQG
jgi:hypothetical protein